jgi:rod shape-determining protein MreC
MRNLIFFIYKYYTFFLFFALEVFAIVIIYRFNNYQKASFVNFTTGVTSSLYTGVNNIETYFSLREVNDSLQQENARLHSLLLTSYYENNITSNSIKDTIYKQQYTYLAAKVVNNSVTKRNNYITINRGRLHGVKPEMAVICESGIEGIVLNVSDHYATVLSFLNNNCKISAKLEKTQSFGSLVWDGINPKYAKLLDVNKHVPVAINDNIITSNYSTIFPEGIRIGRVIDQSLEPGDNFHSITVELYTNFSTLSSVYVIDNIFKEEQQQLETQLTTK